MKRGKTRGKNYFVFIFILLFIIGVLAVGYFTGILGKITGWVPVAKNVALNITVGAPVVITVYNGTASLSLNEGPLYSSRTINFTAYHGAGSQNLNDSTARINITSSGEEPRQNASCSRLNFSTSYVTYGCNVTMWWYDAAGSWNIIASVMDNNSNMAMNSSTTLYLGATFGLAIAPGNLSWLSIGAGSTNQTSSNDPMNLSNTGNQPVGTTALTSNITINSTDLKGELNSGYTIFANNFSVDETTGGTSCSGAGCTECGGGLLGNLSKGLYTNISGAFLPKGNYTVGDGTTGQEQLFFCLRIAGADLISQPYSTVNQGAWTVRIY